HGRALRGRCGLRQASFGAGDGAARQKDHEDCGTGCTCQLLQGVHSRGAVAVEVIWQGAQRRGQDRKSTRLNSSHVSISYAVFCRHPPPPPLFPYPTLFRSPWSSLARSLRPPTGQLRCRRWCRASKRPRGLRYRLHLPAAAGCSFPRSRGCRGYLARSSTPWSRSEEHTSELQSRFDLVCRLLPPPSASSTLSLPDALPISMVEPCAVAAASDRPASVPAMVPRVKKTTRIAVPVAPASCCRVFIPAEPWL